MCGRYSFFDDDKLYERFKVEKYKPMEPRFNVAPSQSMPVVVQKEQRHVVFMKWGLIPAWVPTKDKARILINARVESVTEKPSFRNLLSTNRCLIPANGFFEWDKKGGKHIPYYVHLDKEPLYGFAGLYNRWTDKATGEISDTYTIITTAAENAIKTIHDRMPVILKKKAEDLWLDPNEQDKKKLIELLGTQHENAFEMYPISELVNSPRNDTEGILKRIK